MRSTTTETLVCASVVGFCPRDLKPCVRFQELLSVALWYCIHLWRKRSLADGRRWGSLLKQIARKSFMSADKSLGYSGRSSCIAKFPPFDRLLISQSSLMFVLSHTAYVVLWSIWLLYESIWFRQLHWQSPVTMEHCEQKRTEPCQALSIINPWCWTTAALVHYGATARSLSWLSYKRSRVAGSHYGEKMLDGAVIEYGSSCDWQTHSKDQMPTGFNCEAWRSVVITSKTYQRELDVWGNLDNPEKSRHWLEVIVRGCSGNELNS